MASPEPSAEVLLGASGLRRTFTTGSGLRRARVSAVDGVDLELRAGETLGIVGESGCGKSTLARMLVGLDRPDAGTLRFHGADVTRGRSSDRRRLRGGVQMIFQDPYASLDPRMTVQQLVTEPMAAGRIGTSSSRRDRAAELLETVGMSAEMLGRYAHQFSGGQRQRIGIARALALDPEVLVADEPVSALDVSVQAQVVNLLEDIRTRLGVAIVFIAHDLSVVHHIADRVSVMYLGRIVESGPTEHVFDGPAHPYTQALLSAMPSATRADRGRLSRRRVLGGEPPSPVDPPSGCRFNPRCWMATEECRTVVPLLRRPDDAHADEVREPVADAAGGPARVVACHHAERALAASAV